MSGMWSRSDCFRIQGNKITKMISKHLLSVKKNITLVITQNGNVRGTISVRKAPIRAILDAKTKKPVTQTL